MPALSCPEPWPIGPTPAGCQAQQAQLSGFRAAVFSFTYSFLSVSAQRATGHGGRSSEACKLSRPWEASLPPAAPAQGHPHGSRAAGSEEAVAWMQGSGGRVRGERRGEQRKVSSVAGAHSHPRATCLVNQ